MSNEPTTLGRRLGGLGVPPDKFLQVLERRRLGRAQQRLQAYQARARALGASGSEARLALAAVEHTIRATAPLGPVDAFQLAEQVLAFQLAPTHHDPNPDPLEVRSMYNLPHTGIGAAVLAAVALVAKGVGVVLLRLGRRR